MPPVVAAIGAAWAAVGAWSIGTFAIGTVVQSAIIGAAVGGLSAAVTGGDIGKGMLYGAVGGAVLGGIGAFAGMGSGGTAGAATGATSAASSVPSSVTAGVNAVKGATTGAVVSGGGAGAASGSGLAGMLTGKLGESLVTGGLQMLGGALEGKDAAEEADKQRAWQAEQNEKNRQLQERLASMSGGGGGGSSDGIAIARIQQETALKQLAENRRQYDVARQDQIESRQRAGAALAQAKASTKRYKAGVRSIDEASAQTEVARTGMLQPPPENVILPAEAQAVPPEEQMAA